MAAMSDFLENKLIDWLLRGQALGIGGASAAAGTGPTTVYVALFTTNASDSGGFVEVVGGSYARVAITSNLANWAGTQGTGTTVASTGSSGTTSNNTAITFPTPTASWGLVTGVGVFDAATNGNLLMASALNNSKNINNGDPAPSFPSASLTFQIDN